MKYVGITKSGKIRCIRKDGEQKDYKTSNAVIEFARKTFKKGDLVTGKFEKGELVKLSKIELKNNTYKRKFYNNFSNKGNTDAQSAVKSAATALAGISGVDINNYTEIYNNLIDIGLNKILNKKSTIESKPDELETEEVVENKEEVLEVEDELE